MPPMDMPPMDTHVDRAFESNHAMPIAHACPRHAHTRYYGGMNYYYDGSMYKPPMDGTCMDACGGYGGGCW